MIAYCYRSGHIGFGDTAPRGAIAVLSGKEARLRTVVSATARHSRTDDTLLVPGVPEAVREADAERAMVAWAAWVARRPGIRNLVIS